MKISEMIKTAKLILATEGEMVEVGSWQGLDVTEAPQGETFEAMDVMLKAFIPETPEALRYEARPNLPWAEDHFQERVYGLPSNPGQEYKNWPFFVRQKTNDQFRDEGGQHSHTYMERIWAPQDKKGIRYEYGNLGDVVDLLIREPHTRQAFLPIWFPEDTGSVHGERVPCTLGYHFMIRNNKLNIFYPIRACDLYRHFQDDVYMAARMAQWMVETLKSSDRERFEGLIPGKLNMHIYSFHIFGVEVKKLKREVERLFGEGGSENG